MSRHSCLVLAAEVWVALMLGTLAAFAGDTVVHTFVGSPHDGGIPLASLFVDQSGAIYGTTEVGGNFAPLTTSAGGTVFRLSPPTVAGGRWTETVLTDFGDGEAGVRPDSGDHSEGPVLEDSAGNLYGMTRNGGYIDDSCCGVVYQLLPPVESGSGWTRNVLYAFGSPGGY